MRRYIILASALLACAAASAQNLNPTVQVTNDYEGKLMEVEKQNLQMAVPDSLLKFDWNFNYSVFDNPYKGAYEFSPYRIDMKPDPVRRELGKFYLRAGAGYSLHPEAQLVFTPGTKGRFGISVYDDFKGYIGKYHDLTSPSRGTGAYLLAPVGDYSGNEFSNRLGTALRYDGASSVVTFDGGFDFLKTDNHVIGSNNALGGSAALRLRSIGDTDFVYDASLGWAGVNNKPEVDVPSAEGIVFKENDFGFDASLGFRLAEAHTVGLDPSWHHTIFSYGNSNVKPLEGAWQQKAVKASADLVDLAPYYRFSDEGFTVRVGVRFSDVWRGFEESSPPAEYKGRKLYPDFRLSYEAVPDKLVLSAKVTGGQSFNTYRSYLMSNHHLSYASSRSYFTRTGDATVNTFDAGVGASGRIKNVFQYSVEAGYARYFNSPMDGIEAAYVTEDRPETSSESSIITYFVPVVSMVNYDLLYARLGGDLTTDRFDASARLKLQSDRNTESEKGYFAMSLPLFSGSAELVYNWNRRMFVGILGEWATARDGEGVYSSFENRFDCHVPGWVDLGVLAEFKANNRFSLWAQGRNLLNQTVMRDFMVSEKGLYFTAGICLNF